jgi:hypothetical protein
MLRKLLTPLLITIVIDASISESDSDQQLPAASTLLRREGSAGVAEKTILSDTTSDRSGSNQEVVLDPVSTSERVIPTEAGNELRRAELLMLQDIERDVDVQLCRTLLDLLTSREPVEHKVLRAQTQICHFLPLVSRSSVAREAVLELRTVIDGMQGTIEQAAAARQVD